MLNKLFFGRSLANRKYNTKCWQSIKFLAMTTTSQALKYNVLKETSKMIKLISMVVDIGLMPGMLWLN